MKPMKPVSIYLTGGTRSGWQARLTDALAIKLAAHPEIDVYLFSPTELMYDDALSVLDQAAIQRQRYVDSDIVFGYYEAANTTAGGMFTELGFAAGVAASNSQGMPKIIFCDEHNTNFSHWVVAVTKATAFTDINHAIDALVDEIIRIGKARV